MVDQDGALAHLDAQVFPQVAAARLDLRPPCPVLADSHQDEASLLDADHGAVRPADLDKADAILEALRLRDLKVLGAEKLAVREPRRLAGVVPEHLDKVALRPEHPASSGPAEHCLAELQAAVAAPELYKQDAGRFAA
jgi:hypothetical protein